MGRKEAATVAISRMVGLGAREYYRQRNLAPCQATAAVSVNALCFNWLDKALRLRSHLTWINWYQAKLTYFVASSAIREVS